MKILLILRLNLSFLACQHYHSQLSSRGYIPRILFEYLRSWIKFVKYINIEGIKGVTKQWLFTQSFNFPFLKSKLHFILSHFNIKFTFFFVHGEWQSERSWLGDPRGGGGGGGCQREGQRNQEIEKKVAIRSPTEPSPQQVEGQPGATL